MVKALKHKLVRGLLPMSRKIVLLIGSLIDLLNLFRGNVLLILVPNKQTSTCEVEVESLLVPLAVTGFGNLVCATCCSSLGPIVCVSPCGWA